MADSPGPLDFDVDPDASGPRDEGVGQLGHMLGMAELSSGKALEHEVFHFSDMNGEHIFLRQRCRDDPVSGEPDRDRTLRRTR